MGKFVKSLGSLLLVGVLAAGVCCTGYASRGDNGKWFGNGDIKTWHWSDKSDGEENKDDMTDDTEDLGGAIIGEGENNGVSILSALLPRAAYAANGIDTQADTAFRLTATITPENATNQELVWSLYFNNPLSEWAEGKELSDYATLVPDGNTAALTVCQAFGEQIIVKVASAEDESIFSLCTVDYSKKYDVSKFLIGDIPFNPLSGGKVPFVLSENGGVGGEVRVLMECNSPYTVESNVSCKLLVRETYFSSKNIEFRYEPVDGLDIVGKSVYFDLRFFEQFSFFTLNPIGREHGYAAIFRNDSSYALQDVVGKPILNLAFVYEVDNVATISRDISLKLSSYTIPVGSVGMDNNEIIV